MSYLFNKDIYPEASRQDFKNMELQGLINMASTQRKKAKETQAERDESEAKEMIYAVAEFMANIAYQFIPKSLHEIYSGVWLSNTILKAGEGFNEAELEFVIPEAGGIFVKYELLSEGWRLNYIYSLKPEYQSETEIIEWVIYGVKIDLLTALENAGSESNKNRFLKALNDQNRIEENTKEAMEEMEAPPKTLEEMTDPENILRLIEGGYHAKAQALSTMVILSALADLLGVLTEKPDAKELLEILNSIE